MVKDDFTHDIGILMVSVSPAFHFHVNCVTNNSFIISFKAKKDYEKASQEADVALKSYEQANNSMDLTKAQILKVRNFSFTE